MRKILKFLILRFKEPVAFYIWGGLNLMYGCIFNPIFRIGGNSTLLSMLGLLVLFMGLLLDLGKYRVDCIKSVKLEQKISNIKSVYWQNVIRNIITFYTEYRSRDMYLCRFYRKTGTVLVVFVESVDKAKEYMNWYLDKDNTKYKNINIASNRATKIQPNDIEEFEYQRVSWVQRKIINPALAFLKQPSFEFISLRGITIFSILTIFSIGGYFYLSGNYMFVGSGSYDTIDKILSISISSISTILLIWGLTTVVIGMFSLKSSIRKYYTNTFSSKRTVVGQLLTLALVPLSFNMFIQPAMMYFIKLAQDNGYFLP